MTKHPLSHALYESLEFTALDRAIDAQRDAFKEFLSAAHEVGFERGRDQQLEQVIAHLRHNLHFTPTSVDYIVQNLREAMRPTTTTQENN